MRTVIIRKLMKIKACKKAVSYARQQPNWQAAWDKCERGDWMLWLLGKLSGPSESKSRKKLVLTTCKCARLSLKYIPKKEKRPLVAIETAEKWARGEETLGNVKLAADAAYAAADAADAAAYASYAEAAAHAAYADAADAAYAAAYAADASYADAADAAEREKTLKQLSVIVKKMYPKAPKLMD